MTWPSFMSLQAGWFALLALPLILFYFLKLRRPQVRVPSLVLWQQVINDQRVNSPFQRFKRNLLLLLQLLLLAALVLAAMQPFISGRADRAQYLPVLVDCSASMGATDTASRQTRLAMAVDAVDKLIDDLLPDQRMAIVAVADTAQRVTSFTDNKRVLRQALRELEVRQVASSLEDALRMAQAMARSYPIDSVLLYTDGNVPERIEFELPFDINYQRIGKVEPNLGITALSARRAGTEQWNVFVRIAGSKTTQSGATIELLGTGAALGKGVVMGEDYVRVGDDESARVMFAVDTTEALDLEVRLKPEGSDALVADNQAYLSLPAPRPLKVYCAPTLAAFHKALTMMPDVELADTSGTPTDIGQLPSHDLWIGDREMSSEEGEAAVRLIVGVVPEPLEKLVQINEGEGEVVDWNRGLPLLEHVELGDVVMTEETIIAPEMKESDFEDLGFEVIVHGRRGPLMLRELGETYEGYRLLFDPEASTLVYRVGFPVLVSNLVRVAEFAASLAEVRAASTGTLSVGGLEPNRTYRVETPAGDVKSTASGPDGRLLGVAAPSVGVYRVGEGDDTRLAGASLLDGIETMLVSREEIEFREGNVEAAEGSVANDRPLWSYLVWLAFLVLLWEWWYFHRRHDLGITVPVGTSSRSPIGRRPTMSR